MGGIKKRKALKKLTRRRDEWKGEYILLNPGKQGPTYHIMHRPGSNKKLPDRYVR